MSETKFTPGPWRAIPGLPGEHGYDCIEICGEHGVGGVAMWLGKVQTVTPRKSWDDLTQPPWATEQLKAECEANAHLFVTAPDMYGILERLVDASDRSDVPSWSTIWDEAKAILAKARGEACSSPFASSKFRFSPLPGLG